MATKIKRGPLSKVEIYYIEGHRDLDVEQIATDLTRSPAAVRKYLNDNPVAKGETLMSQQFAKKEGTVVMTQNASEMSDATRSRRLSSTTESSRKNCVTSIRGK